VQKPRWSPAWLYRCACAPSSRRLTSARKHRCEPFDRLGAFGSCRATGLSRPRTRVCGRRRERACHPAARRPTIRQSNKHPGSSAGRLARSPGPACGNVTRGPPRTTAPRGSTRAQEAVPDAGRNTGRAWPKGLGNAAVSGTTGGAHGLPIRRRRIRASGGLAGRTRTARRRPAALARSARPDRGGRDGSAEELELGEENARRLLTAHRGAAEVLEDFRERAEGGGQVVRSMPLPSSPRVSSGSSPATSAPSRLSRASLRSWTRGSCPAHRRTSPTT
jgi:hypothetical protein